MRKLIALAFLLPGVALANGYDLPNTNPRDLAMAGSLVAAQRDAAAAFQNPAALSRLDGLDLSLHAGYLDNRTSWTAPAGSSLTPSSDSTKVMPAPPAGLFVGYGFEVAGLRAGAGAGFNVVAGGNVFWPDQWTGRGRIITVDRKVYGAYLTGGVEVLPRLRLGGGLVYYYTTEYLKQGIQPDPSAYAELATKGGAASYDLSAEYAPLADLPLTFALDYKHKARQVLKGDAHFNVSPALYAANPALVDQSVTHVLTYPNQLHVGAAYRALKPLLLTLDWTLSRYVVYDSDVFQGSTLTITVPRNYRNGYVFRLGGEYEATDRLTIRAGTLRDVSGLRSDTYSPTLPDGNAWVGSLGAGWKVSQELAVDVGAFYAVLDKVTATGAEAFPGSYDTKVFIATVGLTWHPVLGSR